MTRKDRIWLFITALIQVSLVAMNVVFISKGYIILMALTGFGISFIWTFNVRKVVFGKLIDRIIYASGACLGTCIGYYIAKELTHVI